MSAGQKRAPDLIIDGCESPYDCWELNSGPLEEHPVLLTAEPSLQPYFLYFNCSVIVNNSFNKYLLCPLPVNLCFGCWGDGSVQDRWRPAAPSAELTLLEKAVI